MASQLHPDSQIEQRMRIYMPQPNLHAGEQPSELPWEPCNAIMYRQKLHSELHVMTVAQKSWRWRS